MNQQEHNIEQVKLRNETIHLKKKRFIENSIKSFPHLEGKFKEWEVWMSDGRTYYELTPTEYYFFNMVSIFNRMIIQGNLFLKGGIKFPKYLSKYTELKGSLHQVSHYFGYLGRTQMRLKKEMVEEYQNKELIGFNQIPKNIFSWWNKKFDENQGGGDELKYVS